MPVVDSIFAALERFGNTPVHLYTFARNGEFWRLTDALNVQAIAQWGGLTFFPGLITRSRIVRSEDAAATTVRIALGLKVPVVPALREINYHPMAVSIHRHQPRDINAVPVRLHEGNVGAIEFVDGMAHVDVVSSEGLLSQIFPRGAIERTCQWKTYGAQCGVLEELFSFETTITDIDSGVVVVDDIPAAALADPTYYEQGQIKLGALAAPASTQRVHIDRSAGVNMHIFGALPSGVAIGDAVTLIAGDDKRLSTCRDKFDNVDRFTGFDQLPVVDPTQTGLV